MKRTKKSGLLRWSNMRYSILLSLLFSPQSFSDDGADWVETRTLSRNILLETAEFGSEATNDERIRALLTLADQAINRSIVEAVEHLESAETMIRAGSDAELIAKAIRCQLEHRQSLPAAEITCRQFTEFDLTSKDGFIRAFAHVTKMYYFYREGQHERSLEEAELALEFATPMNDPALLAAAHNMFGLHFSTRLRPRMSLPHFESALEHASHLPYTEPKTITQLNLASSYTYLGRGRAALRMLNEASASQVVNLYATRRLVVQSMIGQARAAIGETEGAEEELLRVIDEVSDTVLPDGMSFGYTGLGVIQLYENRPEDALASFDKVLDTINKSFESDLKHPRVQLIAVQYASALRESGQVDAARRLLDNVIAAVPPEEPDQILLDGYRELALTLDLAGDGHGAIVAAEHAAQVESELWDASLKYQVDRLNASMESDRRKIDLERALERESALRATANRETMLRRQTWLIGAMVILVVVLFFSRRFQKRIADSQRAASISLEHEVKERTRELEDEMAKRKTAEVEQRQMTKKMYEGEKLKAMGQLTAGVAHDFNNLMTVVTLGADDLKSRLQQDNDADAADTLEQIHSAADTGAKITRGLLAYVRKQPLQPEEVQLEQFLRDSLPMFRNTLGERISLQFKAESCRVLVDKGQLTTALLNLLINANEAMSGGGEVSVSLRNVDGQAQIEVRDCGVGMEANVLKHAVDPFFTTKDNREGTGLGLSMVYGFARQSNGDLHIDSTLNKGTTITVSLPLVTAKFAQHVENAEQSQRIPKGVRMLAVEDRIQILQVLERSLAKLGAHVITASSADEALSIVHDTGLPDLLITDIVMPGELDGLDLVTKLREQNPGLPVVLMSGYSDIVDDECTFLHKPFSFAELERAIAKTLCQSKQPESTA